MDFYGNDGNDPYGGNTPYQGPNGYYANGYVPDAHVKLATAALVLGIIGMVLGIQVIGIVFAGCAIVLGFLSKGNQSQMTQRARLGVVFGFVGFAIALITAVSVFVAAWRLLPEMLETPSFRETLEQFYGEDTDTVIEWLQETYPSLTQKEPESQT